MKFFGGEPQHLETEEKPHSAGENLETQKEKALQSLEIERSVKLIGNANNKRINEVFLVELHGDGSAIFKPASGEKFPFDWAGELYKNERASYLVDKFLGFNLVPTTVIREVNGEIGSMQEFVFESTVGLEIDDKLLKTNYRDALKKMWVFDYIVWNGDRHDANFLVNSDGLHAIDHGLTFVREHIQPSIYEDFYDESMPEDIIRNLNIVLDLIRKHLALSPIPL